MAASKTTKVKATQQALPIQFTGFSKAGLQFLKDLKKNNDRDWFRERKETYEEHLRQPMEALVTSVAAECRRRGFTLFAKEKSPVMRIYRDIRFSADKSPFHTHTGGSVRRSPGKVGFGEVYIHITPEGSFLAAGFWMPERPFLTEWRGSMAKDPKTFQAVLKSLTKSKLPLSTNYRLSKMPRGFEAHADTLIADYFRLTSYIVERPLAAAEITSPKLLSIAVDFALASRPLLEYGWKLNYQRPVENRFLE